MTTSRIDVARLSALIGLIYDAAIDSMRWPVAAEAIRLELGCANSVLTLQKLHGGEFLTTVATNIPQHYRDPMMDFLGDVLELSGGAEPLMTVPISEPLILSRISPTAAAVDQSTNRRTPEWTKPQSLSDAIAIGVARYVEAFGFVAFARPIKAGAIGEREEELVRLLIPHLQRAATINRMLGTSAFGKAPLEAAIDSLHASVVLTDERMGIVHANPAARAMLADGEFIRETAGILRAASTPVTRALEIAVEHAAHDLGTLGREVTGIPMRGDDGGRGALHVLPLRPSATRLSCAVVAIFVAHTSTPFTPPTDIVAALFDLTPAEARVFEHIAGGLTVAEAAAALGVELSTIKTHLLRIYDKTGVKHRAELQRLAIALTVPVTG